MKRASEREEHTINPCCQFYSFPFSQYLGSVVVEIFSVIISLHNLFFASIFELQVLAGSDYHAS